jgi:hypothetical protein
MDRMRICIHTNYASAACPTICRGYSIDMALNLLAHAQQTCGIKSSDSTYLGATSIITLSQVLSHTLSTAISSPWRGQSLYFGREYTICIDPIPV